MSTGERPRDYGPAWVALLALIALPLTAHLGFSSLGFNPTDDGFILAYSRRLLEGQVPHRDFISIRPVGSAWLHMPTLLLGGTHTVWVGRLVVWFEFGLIAWCWSRLVTQSSGRPVASVAVALCTFVAFAMTSYTFPVMPWHTVDALVLASLGLVLATSTTPSSKVLGYALMGASALCRQNFLPVAPLAALALGDRHRRSVGLAAIAPPVAYVVYLVITGSLEPAILQMSSQTGLAEAGIHAYVANTWCALGIAFGMLVTWRRAGSDRTGSPNDAHARWVTVLVGWALVLGVASTMMSFGDAYVRRATFALFGATLGRTVVLTIRLGARHPEALVGWLSLLVAWCTSISIGLSSPALAAGVLSLQWLSPVWFSQPRSIGFPWGIRAAAGVGLALAVAGIWSTARLNVIYRDGPAPELTEPLGAVLAGGSGVRTNPRTFALLADLNRAIGPPSLGPFAVVADFPAYWVQAGRPNPLSIDWPQATELNRPELVSRVTSELEALRGHGRIIVQRVAAASSADIMAPIEDRQYYAIPYYVRAHFRKTGGTRWFDIYE